MEGRIAIREPEAETPESPVFLVSRTVSMAIPEDSYNDATAIASALSVTPPGLHTPVATTAVVRAGVVVAVVAVVAWLLIGRRRAMR